MSCIPFTASDNHPVPGTNICLVDITDQLNAFDGVNTNTSMAKAKGTCQGRNYIEYACDFNIMRAEQEISAPANDPGR